MRKQAKDKGRRDLIWCVGYADIEIGQVRFDKITNDNVEFSLFRSEIACELDSTGELRYLLSLDTLGDFCRHPRVHLYGSDMFRLFENANGQISSTGTNLQDLVRGTEISLE